MNPFDAIDKFISEHGSAIILRDHVAFLKSQMSAMQAEIDEFKMTLEKRESEIISLKSKIQVMETEGNDLKLQIGSKDKIEADICPYCKQPSLKLLDIQPDKIWGDVGIKKGYYECENCGKKYDRELKP